MISDMSRPALRTRESTDNFKTTNFPPPPGPDATMLFAVQPCDSEPIAQPNSPPINATSSDSNRNDTMICQRL